MELGGVHELGKDGLVLVVEPQLAELMDLKNFPDRPPVVVMFAICRVCGTMNEARMNTVYDVLADTESMKSFILEHGGVAEICKAPDPNDAARADMAREAVGIVTLARDVMTAARKVFDLPPPAEGWTVRVAPKTEHLDTPEA